MKNIHILPTDKPSLVAMLPGKELTYSKTKQLFTPTVDWKTQNIYITNLEEIKEGDWLYHRASNKLFKYDGQGLCVEVKKIILTTDPDLIKDGVQAIDDEFLEWFVKNPKFEWVEIFRNWASATIFDYEIIIPKEENSIEAKQRAKNYMRLKGALEPKQETLEEAMNENGYHDQTNDTLWREGVIFGAKWQQEQDKNKYNDEEVLELLQKALTHKDNGETGNLITAQGEIRTANFYSWFEQFKKK